MQNFLHFTVEGFALLIRKRRGGGIEQLIYPLVLIPLNVIPGEPLAMLSDR